MCLYALAVSAGIIWGIYFNLRSSLTAAVIILAVLFIAATVSYKKNISINLLIIIEAGIAITLALSTGIKAYQAQKTPYFDKYIDNNMEVLISGTIALQTVKDDKTVLYIENSKLQKFNIGKTVVFLDDNNLYSDKSFVYVRGKIQKFNESQNEGQFDEKSYYKSLGINYKITGEIKKIESGGNKYKDKILIFKEKLMSSIENNSVNDKDAGVLKAVLAGDKSDLDTGLKELFKISGIIHIISISGLHISIIGMSLYRLCRKIGFLFKGSAMICTFIMLSYGFMTGFSVSAIRAIVMFEIMMGAQITGRTYDILSALSFAAILILLDNPLYITNTGFQFSFMAIIGISTFVPATKELIGTDNKILTAFLGALSIWIFTIPITAFSYYEISTYSSILNMIIIPLASIMMFFGVAGSVIGIFFPMLGKILLYGAHFIIWFYEKLCETFLKLPNSVYITGKPDIYKIVLFYIVIAFIVVLVKCTFSKKRKIIVTICMLSMSLFILCNNYENSPSITFLDVGQGDAIYINTGKNINIVVDAGSSSIKNVGKYRVIPFLKCRQVKIIDYVVMTHPDSDHINGIEELIESGYDIKNIVISETLKDCKEYESILKSAAKDKINTCFLRAGDIIKYGDFSLKCIHPDINFYSDDMNENSLTFICMINGKKGLLTGDLSGAGEQEVLNNIEEIENCDFLKVGHHGSKSSSCEEFINKVNPLISVISCGKNNRYNHPNKEVVDRLKDSGSEIVMTNGEGEVKLELSVDN